MKAIKFLAVLMAAFTMSFTATSCSDDDDEELEQKQEKKDVGVSELKDNGSTMSFSYWESYAGIQMKCTMYFDYSGTKITSAKSVYECSNSDAIDAIYEDMKKDTDFEKVTKDGKKVTCIYSAESYEKWTTQHVHLMYDAIQKQFGE